MTKIEGLMAYKGAWESRKCFIVEELGEFKHLIKRIKSSGDGAQWILTDTGQSLILHSITYDFRFTHRKRK